MGSSSCRYLDWSQIIWRKEGVKKEEEEEEEIREQKGHSFDLLAEDMDRTVAVAGKDLGMKRPMSFPFSTADSGRDFYGGAERFWQPFSSCKTSSSASNNLACLLSSGPSFFASFC